MYGNPYFNNFRENQQQPIQNIINTQMPLNTLFMRSNRIVASKKN